MQLKWRKWVGLSLSIMLVAAFLAGCAGKKEDASPTASGVSDPSSTSSADQGLPQVDGKFSPEVTITTVRSLGDDVKFKNNETIDNNVFTKWAKDRLGINRPISK